MMTAGETLARHLSTFGELPPADFAAVASLKAEEREVARQTDLLSNGDQPTHIVVILSGLLYRYNIGPEGKRQIHSFYLPSEAPSLETLYIDYMDNNLGAVVPSRVGLISTTRSTGSSMSGPKRANCYGARRWSRRRSFASGWSATAICRRTWGSPICSAKCTPARMPSGWSTMAAARCR